MELPVVFLAKLLKALSSDASPWQLAFGLMLGMIIGLTPIWRVHNLLIFFVVLFMRVNLTTFLISLTLFSGIAYLFDPVMINLGEYLLTHPGMQGSWTAFYNTNLGQLSQFFHTLTLGSLVISLIFAPVLLVISKLLIVQYRERFMVWTNKLKLVQFLKSSRIFQLYMDMRG
jgi:uncharacterized protein (TIGR03546 family)